MNTIMVITIFFRAANVGDNVRTVFVRIARDQLAATNCD